MQIAQKEILDLKKFDWQKITERKIARTGNLDFL